MKIKTELTQANNMLFALVCTLDMKNKKTQANSVIDIYSYIKVTIC
jgi:flagellin-specific chaperone FliS